jgi:nitrogen regulatory protein PII-like uncharacterized protein
MPLWFKVILILAFGGRMGFHIAEYDGYEPKKETPAFYASQAMVDIAMLVGILYYC